MHPLITRFLDAQTALTALAQPQGTDADERALLEAARLDPAAREVLEKARGKAQPSPQSQQALLVLATRAATLRLEDDPAFSPLIAAARTALADAGAEAEEADHLVHLAVLEEAFGSAEGPDEFDAAFLAETLGTLPTLGALSSEAVDQWIEAFVKQGAEGQRALRLSVAEALLEAAWEEGAQPILAEHVEDAAERLSGLAAASEFEAACEVLSAFIGALADQGVVGPLRRERLTAQAKALAAAGLEPAADDDEGDEAGEDEASEDDEAGDA